VTSIARELATWCARVRADDIPSDVLDLNPLRLVDSIGLIVAGSGTPAVAAASAFALASGGKETCTLVGTSQRVPGSLAALVHGVSSHCHDFDDTFADSVVHPGSIVIPTALAAAEVNGSSDDAFSAAISIGYEVGARLGAAAGRRFHARHMHPSGVIGPIMAAVVAARLQGLNEEQTMWAMGLGASMSSGIRAFSIDGAWSKWLHLGWAAHGGIIAAELASRGFIGPEHVLDGGHDLYSALLYGDPVDRSPILSDLGRAWQGSSAEFKYYPCAHVIQPFIDAVLSIMRDNKLAALDLERIECTIAPWAAAIVCEPPDAKLRFGSKLEATGSLPYQLAVAALDGGVSLAALEEENRNRADVATLCRRVTYHKDESLGQRFEGRVDITTKSHHTLSQPATLGRSDRDKVSKKFSNHVASVLGREQAADALSALLKSQKAWQHAAAVLAGVAGR
jgi:2-methylcitrate dehydratase PrpD